MKNTTSLHLPLYALSALVMIAIVWAYSTRIDVSVASRGVVRSDGDALKLISESSGRITQVNVHEGGLVEAGDSLVQLDDQDLRLRERSLLQQIHQTEERLEDLERRLGETAALDETATEIDSADEDATVRSVLLNLDGARERYRRMERLFDEGLTSRQSFEDARLALDRAETERDRPSTVQLKRQQAWIRLNDMAAERIPLRLTLSTAYHDLEQCRLDITRRGIVSPVAGRVTSLPSLKRGEFLSAGAMVASITPTDQTLIVEVWLPTADRPYVAAGQSVRMQFEGVTSMVHRAIDGAVASIAPDAVFSTSGPGGYRVIVRPGRLSADMELGMTLEVRFITRHERLLLLLFERIQREFDGNAT